MTADADTVLCPRGILRSICALCGGKGVAGFIPAELAAAYRVGGFIAVYTLVLEYPKLADHLPGLLVNASAWLGIDPEELALDPADLATMRGTDR